MPRLRFRPGSQTAAPTRRYGLAKVGQAQAEVHPQGAQLTAPRRCFSARPGQACTPTERTAWPLSCQPNYQPRGWQSQRPPARHPPASATHLRSRSTAAVISATKARTFCGDCMICECSSSPLAKRLAQLVAQL